ncbi:MAG: bifunctional tetrahydrofolate synthase/dihydrofolate synthase [Burkholderiales bacterium]|nr:bifunctional tetrahydrofolate synthase/dihydrofolate synthase [Burkholderiales bacterium]
MGYVPNLPPGYVPDSLPRPATLDGWLAYLETLHPKAIALGLDRVRAVQARLDAPIECPVVTVGGTNGKGSTCAMLESILRCARYRTGLYSSPHLLRYNERVRIDGAEADDAQLVAAFNAVEDARGDVPLTYFEHGTLAALWLFARARPDALVLEVGLGGRLDAVNLVDADVAVLTSIDIDHVEWLGPTREDIGREKAGIFRAARPAVCADPDPPHSVLAAARDAGARLFVIGRDYGYVDERTQWRYRGPLGERFGLPVPALRGAYQLANAATALAALDLLRDRLPVDAQAVREGLLAVALPGRFQVLPGRPVTVLDVAHNPHAARALAGTLGSMGYHPQTLAVCGMLKDKDAAGVIAALRPRVDRWFVAGLPGARGGSGEALRDTLRESGVAATDIRVFADVGEAYAAARGTAGEADRIVVFGSFLTVAAALSASRSALPCPRPLPKT